jgi:hypothetical protein
MGVLQPTRLCWAPPWQLWRPTEHLNSSMGVSILPRRTPLEDGELAAFGSYLIFTHWLGYELSP